MAQVSFPVVPFEVPTVVVIAMPSSGRREDGMRPLPTVPIAELPRETVEQMCADFTKTMLDRWDRAHNKPLP